MDLIILLLHHAMKDYDLIEEIVADDLITIGIGELYETYDRAKNHIFD